MLTYPWSTGQCVVGQNESSSSHLRREILEEGIAIYQAELSKKLQQSQSVKIIISGDNRQTTALQETVAPLISSRLCCSQVGVRNTGWGTDWWWGQPDQTTEPSAPDAPSATLVSLCRCHQWCTQTLPPPEGKSPQTSYRQTDTRESKWRPLWIKLKG